METNSQIKPITLRKDGLPDGRVRSGAPRKHEDLKRDHQVTLYLSRWDVERLKHEAIGHGVKPAVMGAEIVRRVLLNWEEQETR